jgi:ribosomal protein L37AE/L43A
MKALPNMVGPHICVKCGREMTIVRNDVYVIHFMDDDKAKGIDVLAAGDLWQCPNCEWQLITGLSKTETGYNMFRGNRDRERQFLARLESETPPRYIEVKYNEETPSDAEGEPPPY